MNRLALLLLLPVLAGAAPFTPLPPPVAPDGTRATSDLPVSQHQRNTGGSDGAGLCVFTSILHSARWQNVTELDGYVKWMQRRPGGGYPSKVDQTMRAYCAERGVPVPLYAQHTGGDVAFLEMALKTGRMPAVTYDGRDDFYRSRIAHMVNLVHLDGAMAAILDNNRPGVFLWMSRENFLARWRGGGGGWAVVLLGPPPPPYATTPGPLPKQPSPPCPNCPRWEEAQDTAGRPAWNLFDESDRFAGTWMWDGWHPATSIEPRMITIKPQGNPPVPPPVQNVVNYGVDLARLRQEAPTYGANDPKMWGELFGADLSDDSHLWHLTAVGSDDFLARVAADVRGLPGSLRSRLHVQSYPVSAWPVSQFALSGGVTLRKPAVGRIGSEQGGYTADKYDATGLLDMLEQELDGRPRPPPPVPKIPIAPLPHQPTPAPPSDPMIDLTPLLTWLNNFSPTAAALGAVGLWVVQFIMTRRGRSAPKPVEPSEPAEPNRPLLDAVLDALRRKRQAETEAKEKAEAEGFVSLFNPKCEGKG